MSFISRNIPDKIMREPKYIATASRDENTHPMHIIKISSEVEPAGNY